MMNDTHQNNKWRATTILAVRKNGKIALIGDGQVSLGQTVMKGNAKKVRQLIEGKVLTGFAGATADAFTLFERLQGSNVIRTSFSAQPSSSPKNGVPRNTFRNSKPC